MNNTIDSKRKAVTALTALAVMGLAVAEPVYAEAIAFSRNDVADFSISASAGTLSLGGGSLFSSGASAFLTGSAGIVGLDTTVPVNVPQQGLGGVLPGEDSYTQTAPGGNQFSRGDAVIDSIDLLGGMGRARNVAETQLNISGTAGSNSATNSFNGTLLLSDPAVVTFGFDATPYMQNFLSAAAAVGSGTNASLGFTISLVKVADGTTVFLWSPDGNVLDTALVDEILDDASLNVAINGVTPGTRTYDPTDTIGGGGLFDCGAVGVACNFSASTAGVVAAGAYELAVVVIEASNATFQVPEPGTLAVLSLGLLGLAVSRRRKAAF